MVAAPIAWPPSTISIRAEKGRRHLKEFVKQGWHVVEPGTEFKHSWHIDVICDHLQYLRDVVVGTRDVALKLDTGNVYNLLINMPPRAMKSLIVSVFFPAWAWIDDPWLRFLYSSYAQDLATDHSVLTRRVIESDWYQENWGDRFQLLPDQNLKTKFANDHQGVRQSTSVRGVGTGKGGHIIVCDDPHNVKEAESDAVREATINWWDKAMSTRLNDPKRGARVIVMQRVHQKDLSGHVLAQGGYDHLCLPMEYEPTDRVTSIGWTDPRIEPGELLAPERFGSAQVADSKRRLQRDYAGQMQQRPSPAEGGTFKRRWWRFWHPAGMPMPLVRIDAGAGEVLYVESVPLPPTLDRSLQSWDMSVKKTKNGSFTVGQVWGQTGANFYLLDQYRHRIDFPDQVLAVQSMAAKWPAVARKLVENKANGPAVVSTLKSKVPGLIDIEPDRDKERRAIGISPYVESGNVYVPHPELAPWVLAFIEEAADFPNGETDDQVDAMSQALTDFGDPETPGAYSYSYIGGDEEPDAFDPFEGGF